MQKYRVRIFSAKARAAPVFAFILILALLATGAGPGGGAAFAAAGGPLEEVYLTVVDSSRVRLNWPEYSGSGYAYVVELKVDESGFSQLAELSRSVTSYEYSGIRASSVYVFRVMLRATYTGREDDLYYNEIVYRPAGTRLLPVELKAEQLSPTEVRISWAYDGSAAFETAVERRRVGDTAYTPAATVPAGTFSYTDTSVDPNTQYRYRLRARYGAAVYSDYAELTVSSAIETPQITDYYALSPSSVYVGWTASSEASRYQLERKLKGETEYTIVASSYYERRGYTDSGVVPGERYIYRVKAISRDGSESLYSDEVEVTAVYIDIARSISATATSDHTVELTWSDLGDRESAYEIWRSDEQFPGWRLLDTLERNAVNYVDTRVGPGETYTYRIQARSAEYDSRSAYSAETVATTTFLPAPSDLAQTRYGASSVNLTWRDNSDGESRFVIERRNGPAGRWTQAATAGSNVTERTALSTQTNSAVYYRVGAYSAAYRSVSYSEPILSDNGYTTTARVSSYTDDADGTGAGAAAGADSDGAGSALGDVGLDRAAFNMLARRGVVETQNGEIVGGGEPVTRGEFVAMLARSLRIDGLAIGSFGDVGGGHAYYTEIMRAARLGFVKAESDGMFFPDRVVTRAEIVAFVYDSLVANGTPPPAHGATALRPFPDAAEVPAGLMGQTRAVFGEHIMIGIAEGSKRFIGLPREATREQAALVVYRYISWLDR